MIPSLVLAFIILAWGLVIGSLLWRDRRRKQRWQAEEVRRSAHLKMVQFNDRRIERTLLMDRRDLFP